MLRILSIVLLVGLVVLLVWVKVGVVAFGAWIESVHIAVVVVSCFSVESVEFIHFIFLRVVVSVVWFVPYNDIIAYIYIYVK